MTRRAFLGKMAGGALGLALLQKGYGVAQQAIPRPNFVFFLVDDLGWTDLGAFGSSFYETPNCDRLAAEGMKFTNAYAACPVCSPTRASIMAGKYPARMATTDWFGAPQPDSVENHWTKDKPLILKKAVGCRSRCFLPRFLAAFLCQAPRITLAPEARSALEEADRSRVAQKPVPRCTAIALPTSTAARLNEVRQEKHPHDMHIPKLCEHAHERWLG